MSMRSTENIVLPLLGRVDKKYKDGTVRINAGTTDKRGYRYVSVNHKRVPVHRIVWEYVHGQVPQGFEIDHINGDPSDNRIVNLRLVTHRQNCENKHRPTGKNKTSGVKGVHWDKARNKWRTHIVVDGKQHHIGRFDNVEDAKVAYNTAAAIHHTHNPHAEGTQ